ncbi:MAG TPA: peptide deformylase [Xanthomonadales bacterium]|nr:peptide deformylase [Xanthomonadales bacterium]
MNLKRWKPVKPPFAKYKKKVFAKAASVTGFIYQIGERPILRIKSAEVPVSKIRTAVMRKKIKYLKSCLVKYRKLTGNGRGIAAVQVGIADRFAVVYTPEKLLIIINPKITKKSENLLKYPEMCMSAVPVIVPLARPAWIEFDYYDETGSSKHWNTKDDTKPGRILNRVFQHEIDHLNGIINVDIVKSPKELILESDPAFYKNARFEEVKN